jgi:hypothetical protein
MTTSDTSGTASGGDNGNGTSSASRASNDPDAIREEIERTRDDLAETVDALHAKLDVKSQARARLDRIRSQATTSSGKPRPEVIAGVGGVVLVLAGIVWWRKD